MSLVAAIPSTGMEPHQPAHARAHDDERVLLGVFPEDPGLRGRAVFAHDVVEYEIVERAVQFLCAVFDADVAEHARVDSPAVSIGGLERSADAIGDSKPMCPMEWRVGPY